MVDKLLIEGCAEVTLINKFKQLMKDAHQLITAEEEGKESKKLGMLRAGSCGALLPSGEILAADCGRKAQARYLGYQTTPTENSRVMFEGGLTLENHLAKRFSQLGLPYWAEKEYIGEIASGITISGRPDFEVEIDGKLVGIEVKSLASPFSVIKLYKNGFPFMKHLLQAATYMLLTKRDQWMIAVGQSFNTNQNGQKIDSQLRWFRLVSLTEFGRTMFHIFNEKDEMEILPFTAGHIIGYYKEILEKTKQKVLVVRPKEKELNVDTYDRCRYCPMQSACNKYDNNQIDFEQWLEEFKLTKEA